MNFELGCIQTLDFVKAENLGINSGRIELYRSMILKDSISHYREANWLLDYEALGLVEDR